ncbi:MAG: hypothetical protein ACRDQ5_12240 [Sciscionella sp.]
MSEVGQPEGGRDDEPRRGHDSGPRGPERSYRPDDRGRTDRGGNDRGRDDRRRQGGRGDAAGGKGRYAPKRFDGPRGGSGRDDEPPNGGDRRGRSDDRSGRQGDGGTRGGHGTGDGGRRENFDRDRPAGERYGAARGGQRPDGGSSDDRRGNRGRPDGDRYGLSSGGERSGRHDGGRSGDRRDGANRDRSTGDRYGSGRGGDRRKDFGHDKPAGDRSGAARGGDRGKKFDRDRPGGDRRGRPDERAAGNGRSGDRAGGPRYGGPRQDRDRPGGGRPDDRRQDYGERQRPDRRPPPAGEPRNKPRETVPELPEGAEYSALDHDTRRDLGSLPKQLAEQVGAHLAAAGMLVDTDPDAALAHARFARKKAARVGVVREAVGLTAYHAGEWAVSLAELRAVRRMTGRSAHLAVMADCERALGRPEQALELAADARTMELSQHEVVELRIVAAGARRDMGQLDAAVVSLQGPELDPKRTEPWVARLCYAYADNLAAVGRTDEAVRWFLHAAQADSEEETDAGERAIDLAGGTGADDELDLAALVNGEHAPVVMEPGSVAGASDVAAVVDVEEAAAPERLIPEDGDVDSEQVTGTADAADAEDAAGDTESGRDPAENIAHRGRSEEAGYTGAIEGSTADAGTPEL